LGAGAAAAQDQWKAILEGVVSLAACAVLTYMVFWMDQQARAIRPHLETEMASAVAQQALPAIAALPFLAVFREGAESALFLNAVALQSGAAVSWVGSLLGAGLALVVTTLIFVGGRRVPLKALFRSTGWLLLLLAAGLLAYGIHELQEIGWLPTLIDHVWNINHLLNEKQGLGAFLKSLLGYNGNPSLLEVIAYVAYLAGVSWALKRAPALAAANAAV
jgi:high-affinity iron transporter